MESDLTENLPCADSWTLTGHTVPLDPHVQVCPYSNWRVDLVGHKVVRHRSYGHYHMRILMLGVSLWGRGEVGTYTVGNGAGCGNALCERIQGGAL